MIKKRSGNFLNFWMFLFFCHGALYFLTGDIYDENNPLKLLKYVILLVMLITMIFSLSFNPVYRAVVLPFQLYLSLIAMLYLFNGLSIYAVMMFLIPTVFYFFSEKIQYDTFLKILTAVSLIATAFAVMEFAFFRHISMRFSSTGFRSISIFVNPNNFGVFTSLTLALIVGSEPLFYKKYKPLIWIVAGISIALSGSMTAVGIYSFIITSLIMSSIFHGKISKLFICFAVLSIAAMSTLPYLNYGEHVRSVDSVGLNSVSARFEYLHHFMNAVADNPFFPLFHDATLYADNAFVYAWISTGLIGAFGLFLIVLFMIYLSLVSKDHRKYLLFYLSILMAAMTTNILNIWPIAYIFWGVVGYSSSGAQPRMANGTQPQVANNP